MTTDSHRPDAPDRREFMKFSAAAVGSFAILGAFEAFLGRARCGESRSPGYGKIRPVKDETTGLELLKLPEGFRYLSFGWTGDLMNDGVVTPGSHDGMAVIAQKGGRVTICRNHEVRKSKSGRAFGEKGIMYDTLGGGGCAHLEFDTKQGQWAKSKCSLSGTVKNCAGGPTPWGSWLSCEEAVAGPEWDEEGADYQNTHGWIFEVPLGGASPPVPLKEMGRMVHEAIAVDPATDFVYETEDRTNAGLYRFRPNTRKKLADGGVLEMLKVPGRDQLKKGCRIGEKLPLEWVNIDDPTRGHFSNEKHDQQGVYHQGKQKGAATFARLEGCWYGNGLIYFDSTSGGDENAGQIWALDPAEQELRLIFESPGKDVLDSPDNLAVSPRGGIVLCEDGSTTPQRLHGLTPEGKLFSLAANNIDLRDSPVNGFKKDYRNGEWAGATFSPDGKWLFVNIQRPGVTFAITGPWEEGAL